MVHGIGPGATGGQEADGRGIAAASRGEMQWSRAGKLLRVQVGPMIEKDLDGPGHYLVPLQSSRPVHGRAPPPPARPRSGRKLQAPRKLRIVLKVDSKPVPPGETSQLRGSSPPAAEQVAMTSPLLRNSISA